MFCDSHLYIFYCSVVILKSNCLFNCFHSWTKNCEGRDNTWPAQHLVSGDQHGYPAQSGCCENIPSEYSACQYFLKAPHVMPVYRWGEETVAFSSLILLTSTFLPHSHTNQSLCQRIKVSLIENRLEGC